jgi:hypothetical protein
LGAIDQYADNTVLLDDRHGARAITSAALSQPGSNRNPPSTRLISHSMDLYQQQTSGRVFRALDCDLL